MSLNKGTQSKSSRDAVRRRLSVDLENLINDVTAERGVNSVLQQSFSLLSVGTQLQAMSSTNAGSSVFEPLVGYVLEDLGLGETYQHTPRSTDADFTSARVGLRSIECKFSRQSFSNGVSRPGYQVFNHIHLEEDKLFLFGWIAPEASASETLVSGRHLLEAMRFGYSTRDQLRNLTGAQTSHASIGFNALTVAGQYAQICDESQSGDITWLLENLSGLLSS